MVIKSHSEHDTYYKGFDESAEGITTKRIYYAVQV